MVDKDKAIQDKNELIERLEDIKTDLKKGKTIKKNFRDTAEGGFSRRRDAMIVSEIKDIETMVEGVDDFIEYIEAKL
jgi:hypothetical protein